MAVNFFSVAKKKEIKREYLATAQITLRGVRSAFAKLYRV